MTARIFISYRSSDGKDKATALARDLGAVFGDDTIFLDKDDLRGGSAWRTEVQRLIEQKPVLLLLMTPQLLGAADAAGHPRISDPQDPVRREFTQALEAGATIIPLLCDGLDAAPPIGSLPAPFDQIGERTWRKLRAYDWRDDVERLVQDLKALGLERVAASAPTPVPAPGRRAWLGAATAVLLAAAAGAVVWWRGAASPVGVGGQWRASVEGRGTFVVVLREQGGRVLLTSTPVAIAERAEWADYRRFWRERNGADLEHIVYRGEGTLRNDPGVPLTIDVALTLVSSPGDAPVDSGNLQAALEAGGATLHGKLWLNSEQADRPIVLQRQRG